MASANPQDTEQPILVIGEFKGTLCDATILPKFRQFLRALDGRSKAAPEVKGRFEHYLDFVTKMEIVYSLPESESAACHNYLVELYGEFFNCPPANRLSVTSQVALRTMAEHLKTLSEQKTVTPNLELTRPVYEDCYRKLQQKHDVFKKNYKPTMNLHTLLCLLS